MPDDTHDHDGEPRLDEADLNPTDEAQANVLRRILAKVVRENLRPDAMLEIPAGNRGGTPTPKI